MEKLEDATKTEICTAEKKLKMLEREKGEPLKMIDQLRLLILSKTQRQAEELNSQLEFLQLLNQDNLSLDELDNAFEGQISAVEKQCQILQDEKINAQSKEAVDKIIHLGNLILLKLETEKDGLETYFEFLCFGHQIVLETMMPDNSDKSSKTQKMDVLTTSISEIQEAKEELIKKRAMLDENLEETNKLEEFLMATKRRLEGDFSASHSNFPDRPGLQAVKKEKLPEVDDEVVPEMADYLNPKPEEKKNINLHVCKKEIDVQDSTVEIIEIEDDETSETSSSVAEASCIELSSDDDTDVLEVSSLSRQQANVTTDVGKRPPKLKTNCNQKKLHRFLSELKDEKKRVIEESIFKPYLSISPRNSTCPLNLIQALVELFDARADSFIIDNHPLKFCAKEIEQCYDGRHVDFTTTVKLIPDIIHRYFGSQTNIPTKEFEEKLRNMHVNKNNADDFLRLSVLFMFNVFFFPTTGKYMTLWPLRYLVNLEDFNSYGWGRAIFDYLMTSIRKAANEVAENVISQTSVKGCLPLLESLVYERIGTHHLKPEVDPEKSHPFILKYRKGDSRPSTTISTVLAKLKFDKVKECEGCSPCSR